MAEEKNEIDDSELDSILGGDESNLGKDQSGNGDSDGMDFINDFIDDAEEKPMARKAGFDQINSSETTGTVGGFKSSSSAGNMSLLLDVPMRLTVELGRTQRSVKDILSLNVGSVLELDKLSGEPVDLLVNGKIIAKAEVVVIDENFGVRITEIVVPKEKMILEL